MSIILIAAVEKNNGIGKDGKIPWSCPADMKWFRTITSDVNKLNTIIMGRKTYESIGRPLKGRYNVVLTRGNKASESLTKQEDDLTTNLFYRRYLICAINEFKLKSDKIFIIGGEEVYRDALQFCNTLYITYIKGDYKCDRYLPNIPQSKFILVKVIQHDEQHEVIEYIRTEEKIKGEDQYIDLIEDILNNGHKRIDRTQVGCISVFGRQLRFPLNGQLPLLTTKRVFWKGIVEELLWFLRGETNVKILQERGVHIWDKNSSSEFLSKNGLEWQEGDIGPTYGFNFRHFGEEYQGCDVDHKGVDQLTEVLRLIKEDPTSRRIIISLWDPSTLNQVALPPCLLLYQFYVNENKLSCSVYQRSGDMGLGVPFNIASASLLTYILAKMSNLTAHELIYTLGDAHIYLDHIEELKKQIKRTPRPFPLITIENTHEKVEEWKFEDFKLFGYNPHEKIAMQMAV